MNNFKILAVILGTFIIAFITSFLLDFLPFTENPVKYILVVLFICLELYFGFLIYQFLTTSKEID